MFNKKILILQNLSMDIDVNSRILAAKSKHLTMQIIENLSNDNEKDVLLELFNNEIVPLQIKEKISKKFPDLKIKKELLTQELKIKLEKLENNLKELNKNNYKIEIKKELEKYNEKNLKELEKELNITQNTIKELIIKEKEFKSNFIYIEEYQNLNLENNIEKKEDKKLIKMETLLKKQSTEKEEKNKKTILLIENKEKVQELKNIEKLLQRYN